MTVAYNMNIDLTVEIGFVSDPTVALVDTVWTDVTADLRGWESKRGKQHELDRFEAGLANFLLDNRNGDYDPTNPNSVHSPNVKVDRRIRARARHATEPVDIFNGFIKVYRQIYPTLMSGNGDAVVRLECVGLFGILAVTELPESVWAAEIQADLVAVGNDEVLWFRLNDSEEHDVAVNSGPGGAQFDGTYRSAGRNQESLVFLSDNRAIEFVDRLSDDEQLPDAVFVPKVITSYPFTVELWFKVEGDGVVGQEDDLTFFVGASAPGGTFSPGAFFGLSGQGKGMMFVNDGTNDRQLIGTTPLDDGLPHHIVYDCAAADVFTLWVDGFQETATETIQGTGLPAVPVENVEWSFGPTFASNIIIVPPYVVDEIILWAGVNLNISQIRRHALAGLDRKPFGLNIVWGGDTPQERIGRILDFAEVPVTDRVLDVGRGTWQPTELGGVALEYLQKAAETEFGAIFEAASGHVTFVDRDSLFTGTRHSEVQVTFGDSEPEVGYVGLADPVLDDTQILNDASVARDRSAVRHVEDTASITEHYRQKFTATDLLHDSDLVSQNYAEFIVANFGEPSERIESVTIDVDSLDVAELGPAVFDRELLDQVRLVRRPPGSLIQKVQDSLILSVEHRSTASPRRWQVTYQLTPRGDLIDQFWLLGVVGRSELGQTTVLGF